MNYSRLLWISAVLGLVSVASCDAPKKANTEMPAEAPVAFKAAVSHDFVVTLPDKSVVSERGDSQTISVVLTDRPTSKVILGVESSDKSEGKVEPKQLTFMRENWDVPQNIVVTGVDDKVADGDIKFEVRIGLNYTKDDNYKSLLTRPFEFVNLDDEQPEKTAQTNDKSKNDVSAKQGSQTKLRIMAANITSGEEQSYDPGEGIRIFKALKPDIVLIQEFNYTKNSINSFVASTFGKEYQYHRGNGRIPNGIISKFPITSSGSWKSNKVSDREWDWAVVDIPGERDLLAVSVHLYTKDNAAEMVPLRKKIEEKVAKDKKDYYIILGGDFNQPDWGPIQSNLGSLVEVGKKYADWPQDQEGMVRTNATRHKQLDYLLCNPSLCALETPVVIGKRSYPKGHVVDSRVYQKFGELNAISPVKASDSEAEAMQHMAVVREFTVTSD